MDLNESEGKLLLWKVPHLRLKKQWRERPNIFFSNPAHVNGIRVDLESKFSNQA